MMKRSMLSGLLAAVSLILAACSGQTSSDPDQPLFVPAIDYADFTPAPGCTSDVADATYRACIDPEALYATAVQSAADADNPLMVIWGFEECPYCKKFAQDEMDPNNPRTARDFVTNTLSKTQRNNLPNKGKDSRSASCICTSAPLLAPLSRNAWALQILPANAGGTVSGRPL